MPDPSPLLLYWPLLPVAAYLLGSVPFAYPFGRVKGMDLRTAGTDNVGAGTPTRVEDYPERVEDPIRP